MFYISSTEDCQQAFDYFSRAALNAAARGNECRAAELQGAAAILALALAEFRQAELLKLEESH